MEPQRLQRPEVAVRQRVRQRLVHRGRRDGQVPGSVRRHSQRQERRERVDVHRQRDRSSEVGGAGGRHAVHQRHKLRDIPVRGVRRYHGHPALHGRAGRRRVHPLEHRDPREVGWTSITDLRIGAHRVERHRRHGQHAGGAPHGIERSVRHRGWNRPAGSVRHLHGHHLPRVDVRLGQVPGTLQDAHKGCG